MAKSKVREKRPSESLPGNQESVSVNQGESYDPALATLFANSLGPVVPPSKTVKSVEHPSSIPSVRKHVSAQATNSNGNSINQRLEDAAQGSDSESKLLGSKVDRSRKRKRGNLDDDLEATYMNNLTREESKEDERDAISEKRSKRVPSHATFGDSTSSAYAQELETRNDGSVVGDDEGRLTGEVPQHESLAASKEDVNLEKPSRTVFLANVSTLAIKSKGARKTLLDHLNSFTSSLSQQNVKHKVESLRFRSTAFSDSGVPRKAAYVRKQLMDTTTKSTNAYVVYTTQVAAREAPEKLNGTIVLDRHLRVDSVAHPAKTDHRRCVFVGNLGFVDDTSNVDAAEDEENNRRPRKARDPADVEEGLWRSFGKLGIVESVRVVRDKTTRVGKGFAYVQFKDVNTVEKALLYDGKKFPPMLPRILRVTRAKNSKKANNRSEKDKSPHAKASYLGTDKAKVPFKAKSVKGRDRKLLGHAGAAKSRAKEGKEGKQDGLGGKSSGTGGNPAPAIFEGFRATINQKKGLMKSGGSKKKPGKPSARSKEFKAKGRRKSGS